MNNQRNSDIYNYINSLNGGINLVTGRKESGKTRALMTICKEWIKSGKRALVVSALNKSDFIKSFLNQSLDINKIRKHTSKHRIDSVIDNDIKNYDKYKTKDYIDIEFCPIDFLYEKKSFIRWLTKVINKYDCRAIFILEDFKLFFNSMYFYTRIRDRLIKFYDIAQKRRVNFFIKLTHDERYCGDGFYLDTMKSVLYRSRLVYDIFDTSIISGEIKFLDGILDNKNTGHYIKMNSLYDYDSENYRVFCFPLRGCI